MVFDVDVGAVFGIVAAVGGAFWALLKVTMAQYDKRQEERFATLALAMERQKTELDEHMRRQDNVMAEIRRVENELVRAKLDNLQLFQSKADAAAQHAEILNAIRALGARIDQIIAQAPPRGKE